MKTSDAVEILRKRYPRKPKPIAILTINKDVSKMTLDELNNLNNWLHKRAFDLSFHRQKYKKCRFRLEEKNDGK